MKPIELIQFVEANAKEISSKEDFEQDEMMCDVYTCVLRPYCIPKTIREKMTNQEFHEYDDMADYFYNAGQIQEAVERIKEWVRN